MRRDTELLAFCAAPGDPHRPVSTPIYQTATFAQDLHGEAGAYDYSRSGNPTRTVLEDQLARLDGAAGAWAFSSGMAALAAVLELTSAGDRVVCGDDLYGGTYRLLERVLRRRGVSVTYVDARDLEAVAAAVARPTRLVLLESPTNPLQHVADLRGVAEITRAAGALLVVDASLMSPYLQRPLDLGADVVVHSATKLLGGHSDVTAGAVCVADAAVGEAIAFAQNALGSGLGPFEAWLLLRGTRTLAVRARQQQETTLRIARWLQSHPAVTRVHYVGLDEHPGSEVHRRQARGPGVVLAFETGDVARSRAVAASARLITTAVSFGSVSSTISLPCAMSHASIPADVRAARALPEDLVRLSCGLEDPDDLEEDLAQALDRACRGSLRAVG